MKSVGDRGGLGKVKETQGEESSSKIQHANHKVLYKGLTPRATLRTY